MSQFTLFWCQIFQLEMVMKQHRKFGSFAISRSLVALFVYKISPSWSFVTDRRGGGGGIAYFVYLDYIFVLASARFMEMKLNAKCEGGNFVWKAARRDLFTAFPPPRRLCLPKVWSCRRGGLSFITPYPWTLYESQFILDEKGKCYATKKTRKLMRIWKPQFFFPIY